MANTSQTWSPFQSPEVREICAHMTDGEVATALQRAKLYGLWVFATFAGPLSSLWMTRQPALLGILIALPVVHVLCIPWWLRSQKQFLCSTAWARDKGYSPEQLRLFPFWR
jgi:hypothetical protein